MSSVLARMAGEKRSHPLLELTWAATVEIGRSSWKRPQKDHMPLLGENQKESESAFYRDAYTPVCCCAGHNSQEAEPEMEPVHPQTNWGRGGGGKCSVNICTTELYSVKRNEIMKGRKGLVSMLSEISHTLTSMIFSDVWNLNLYIYKSFKYLIF